MLTYPTCCIKLLQRLQRQLLGAHCSILILNSSKLKEILISWGATFRMFEETYANECKQK